VNNGDGWSSPTFGAIDADGYSGAYDRMNHAGARFYYGSIGFQGGASAQSCNWQVTQGYHGSSMVVGMGDGSVRGVSSGVSVSTWVNACNPRDGNVLGSDW